MLCEIVRQKMICFSQNLNKLLPLARLKANMVRGSLVYFRADKLVQISYSLKIATRPINSLIN